MIEEHNQAQAQDLSGTDRRTFVVESESGERLDLFLSSVLKSGEFSRSRFQELIRSGQVQVDGEICRRPSLKLSVGQTIELVLPETSGPLVPHQAEIRVTWSDDHLVIVDKPAGLTVHPAPSCHEPTLVHRLVHHFPHLAKLDGLRPGIVHRLDKDTSGLMLVALSESVRLTLAQAFADHSVDKTYLALVHGCPKPKQGEIDQPLGRHPLHRTRMAVLKKGGRPAKTAFDVLWTSPDQSCSLLEVRIFTGRTHQIRVHLSHLGHSILGDTLYGGAIRGQDKRSLLLKKLINRQLLHAWRLQFSHPTTGKRMDFSVPLPRDFVRALLFLSRQCQRIALTGMPGSGKSSVLQCFAEHGVPVWSADEAVQRLYQRGRDGWTLLSKRFGPRFCPMEAASVDKPALLSAMAQEPRLYNEVQHLIHPLVLHDLSEFLRTSASARICAAEVPLLSESGWDKKEVFDFVAGVYCPDEIRHTHLQNRGVMTETAAVFDSWQWSQKDKLARCQFVIDNSGSIDALSRRTTGLNSVLRWLRRHSAQRFFQTLQTRFGRGYNEH